jgi:hypothetical protein
MQPAFHRQRIADLMMQMTGAAAAMFKRWEERSGSSHRGMMS